MKMIVFGIATGALGAALAQVSARTLKLLPLQTMREPARKLSRPTASSRKRFMPVVWRAAPFAAPLAGTTEPRRSWLPSAAGHKTSVECIKRLQARACSRPQKAFRLDFIDDALWQARGSGVRKARVVS
jgi:hypothetical protein